MADISAQAIPNRTSGSNFATGDSAITGIKANRAAVR